MKWERLHEAKLWKELSTKEKGFGFEAIGNKEPLMTF